MNEMAGPKLLLEFDIFERPVRWPALIASNSRLQGVDTRHYAYAPASDCGQRRDTAEIERRGRIDSTGDREIALQKSGWLHKQTGSVFKSWHRYVCRREDISAKKSRY